MSIFDDLDDDEEPFIPPSPEAGDFLDLAPPTRHKPKWWQRSETEFWFTDMPEFSSIMDRGRWTVEEMARSVLATLAADEDDPVLERPDGSPVSLTELLAEMDAMEMDQFSPRDKYL